MDIYLDSTIELIKIKYLVLGMLIGFAFGFAKIPGRHSIDKNQPDDRLRLKPHDDANSPG